MDSQVSFVSCDVLKLDHSFKVPKYVCLSGIGKLFEGLYTAVNQNGQIRLQNFVVTTGMEQISHVFESMITECNKRLISLPRYVYLDNCCQARTFFESKFPHLKVTQLSSPPYFRLPPDDQYSVVHVNSYSHAEVVLNELMDRLRIKYISMDAEWVYNSNFIGKLAILQLCYDSRVYIFHCLSIRCEIPRILELFTNPDIIKHGRAVRQMLRSISEIGLLIHKLLCALKAL